MNWFLVSLLPPALWSITNYFDKYLLSKYFKSGGVGALMVFSSIIGLFLLPVIAVFHPEVVRFSTLSLFIAANGFIYILACLPYFYALQQDDTSICVPLFQLVPVFSFILGYIFLGETLTVNQILGGLLVVSGAIAISLDLSKGRKIKIKKTVFWLMMLSSLLFALNFLLFKYFAVQSDFWFTGFWEYTGFAVFALLMVTLIKPYRDQFINVFKTNRTAVLGLNGTNEIINIVAKITFNFATLLTPVTLVWIINGLQPFFVFVYGVILTLLFPKIIKEDISKQILVQKLLAITVMLIGIWLVNRN